MTTADVLDRFDRWHRNLYLRLQYKFVALDLVQWLAECYSTPTRIQPSCLNLPHTTAPRKIIKATRQAHSQPIPRFVVANAHTANPAKVPIIAHAKNRRGEPVGRLSPYEIIPCQPECANT